MLVILLFADDQIVFGDSPLDLQCKLNRSNLYCYSLGLEVNCIKTKIMVCRKRGALRDDEKWNYGEEDI